MPPKSAKKTHSGTGKKGKARSNNGTTRPPPLTDVPEIKLEEESNLRRMEEEERKIKNVGSETRKAIYLFSYHQRVPYNHTLYAVDLPNNLEDAPLNSGSLKLSPILAFKSEEYPDYMSCVEVEGKLYLVGGNDCEKHGGFYPKDVHIFDPLTASLDKPLLTKGPEMNTGKCNPFVFAVGRDIYVLSQWKVDNLSTFEVLRADASGHYAEWEILEEPPFPSLRIGGHLVIGERLFLPDSNRIYDTLSSKWTTSDYRTVDFLKRAHFVDDHLYTCYFPYVVNSYGSFPARNNDFHQRRATWNLRITEKSNTLGLRHPQSQLAYIGESCFCHVIDGSQIDPDRPDEEFPHTHFIGLTIFKALTKRYTDKQKRTYFKCKLLQCMHFANKNIPSGDFYIHECFVLPSCGIKPAMEDDMVFSRLPIVK